MSTDGRFRYEGGDLDAVAERLPKVQSIQNTWCNITSSSCIMDARTPHAHSSIRIAKDTVYGSYNIMGRVPTRISQALSKFGAEKLPPPINEFNTDIEIPAQ